jgi:hypothetical protein
MITCDALQRLEITAMVVDVQQEQQRSVPEVPTGGTPSATYASAVRG